MSGMAPPNDTRRLNSPGPISDRFLLSRAFVKVIIGPVGSAKTLTALRAGRRVGQKQKGKVDDRGRVWRKARVGVIRESYPQIEKNTLPSWFRIHAESDGKFSWRAPYSHQLRLILGEDAEGQANDILDLEVEFRAIGDKSVEEACRGWEINACVIDEADLQPPDLLAFLSGRVGRFSDLDPAMVVDPQIIMCLNAPYTDNWVYKMAVERELGELLDPDVVAALGGRELIETFIQPGGREPNAENLHNLPGGRGYYVIQAALNKHRPGYVERMIDNKFVPMQHGQPVNPQFSYAEHVRPLEYDARRKLVIGVDQGLFAAAVATQRDPMGQLRSLAECVMIREEGKSLMKVGPTAFGKMLRAMLSERFADVRPDRIDFSFAGFMSSPLIIPPHLDKYILYIINTGQSPLATKSFDDDWEPIGPTIRRDLRNVGAILERDDGLMLSSRVSSGAALDERSALRQAPVSSGPIDSGGFRVVLDPAAFAAHDREDSEHDWVLAFQKALGTKVHRAKSNRQALRLEAVHRAMDAREGYAIDPSCKHLIRAHLGGYHYRKAEISDGETRGHLEIADTIYTHVADAEQYAALEGEHVIGDIRGKARRRGPVRNDSDFDVHAGVG